MRTWACMTAVVALGVFSMPRADDVVRFEDGRSLEVRHWEAEGDLARLSLVGGGEIYVPMSRIATVERKVVVHAVEPAPAVQTPAPRRRHRAGPPVDWRSAAGEFAEVIEEAAERHDLDPRLLAAIAKVESDFDPYAVSHKGACGLLQLMPATAERFGVEDLFDAAENVQGGAGYLRWLLDRFDGKTELALAAYNAGEGAVERHGGVPPYPETREYVKRVLRQTR